MFLNRSLTPHNLSKDYTINKSSSEGTMITESKRIKRSFRLVAATLSITLLLSITTIADAAHSRRRPVVRRVTEPRYDRSITTFSSDGRLQQVEYGMEAARRGDTVAALATEQLVAVATVASSQCQNKVHRIDHHILLVTTGLVGDGRALASALRSSCQQFRLSYGEPPTVSEVAKMAAKMQHDLTRTGGARPLGCSGMVVGVDPVSGRPRLYQTEPGGIVEECEYCAAGKGRDLAMESLGKDYDDHLRHNHDEAGEKESDDATCATRAVACAALGKESIQDDDDARQVVDGWIIRAAANRRGRLSVTCYRNLDREALSSLTILTDRIQAS